MRSVFFRAVETSLGGWLSPNSGCNISHSKSNNLEHTSPIRSDMGSIHFAEKNFSTANYDEEDDIVQHTVITYPLLSTYLDSLGLTCYLEEISLILSEDLRNGIKDWSVERLQIWMSSLKFLGANATYYSDIIATELIDGECFLELTDKEWNELGFDSLSRTLLLVLRDGCNGTNIWGVPIRVPKNNNLNNNKNQHIPGNPNQYDLLLDNINTNTSYKTSNNNNTINHKYNKEIINKLQYADKLALETGQGSIYGQIVVLGYKVNN
jgi:hypothetical protein